MTEPEPTGEPVSEAVDAHPDADDVPTRRSEVEEEKDPARR